MGSECCMFVRLSLQGVPRQYRGNRVAQRVKEKSPFALTGYQARITGDLAEIWLWDKAGQQAQQHATLAGRHARLEFLVLPEHLLLPPMEDGFVRRVAPGRTLLEKWQGGTLQGCRSFNGAVDPAELDAFQRGFGAHDAAWQEAGFDYLDRPRHLPAWWQPASLAQPGMVAMLLIASAAALLLGASGNWLGWERALATQRAAIAAAMDQVAPQLAARDAFLHIQSQNNARAEWLAKPSPLVVAAEFEHLVGAEYRELQEWEQQGSTLKAVINAGDTAGRRLLESLQASPLFTGVRVEPGLQPDALVILAQLTQRLDSTPLFAVAAHAAGAEARD